MSSSTKKISDIEKLRGIAVLFVLWYHCDLIGRHLPFFLRITWSGVDLFFAISGFVVARSLMANLSDSKKALATFYLRRCYRILPLAIFWLVIPTLLAIGFNHSGAFGYSKDCFREMFAALSLQYNYVLPSMMGGLKWAVFGHYWSLCVEEHFYLLLPPLLLLFPTFRNRIALCLTVMVLCPLLRVLMPPDYVGASPQLEWAMRGFTHLRADSLAIGVLLALIEMQVPFNANRKVRAGYVVPFVLAAIIALSPGLLPNFYMQRAGYSFLAFTSAALVAAAVWAPYSLFGSGLLGRALEYIGSRSFALYLCHLPAFRMMYELRFRFFVKFSMGIYSDLAMAAGAWALSFIFAELSYRLIEQPFMNRGKRASASVIAEPTPTPANHFPIFSDRRA